MTKIRASIVDYAVGNVQSVLYACRNVAIEATITDKPEHIKDSDLIILPGVGSFPKAVNTLRQKGLFDEVVAHAHTGKPFLGICLGMHLMFEAGFEDGVTAGLNILKGSVRDFRSLPEPPKKVPHIGFNTVNHQNGSKLFAGIEQNAQFYFLHSYFVDDLPTDSKLATCHYSVPFLAAFEKDNIFGTQFHPEKSQTNGLMLLANFSQVL